MGGSNETNRFSTAVFVTNVTDGYNGDWYSGSSYPFPVTDEACAVAYTSSGTPYVYCMGGYGNFSGNLYDTNYTAAAQLGPDSVGSWVTQPKPPSDFGVGITFPSCFEGSSIYTGTEIFCVGGWNQNAGVTTDGTVYAHVNTNTGSLDGWNYSTSDSPQGPDSSVGQERCAYYNATYGYPYVYCVNGVQPNWDGISFNNVAESYGTYAEVQSNGSLGGWNSTGGYIGAPVSGEESSLTCSGASTGQYGAAFASCAPYGGTFICVGGQAGNNGNDGLTNAGCDANDQSTGLAAYSTFGFYNGEYWTPLLSWLNETNNAPLHFQRSSCVVAITSSTTPVLYCIGGFVGIGQNKTTGGVYFSPLSGGNTGAWSSENTTKGAYWGYGTSDSGDRQIDSEACVSYTVTTTSTSTSTTVVTNGASSTSSPSGAASTISVSDSCSVYGSTQVTAANGTLIPASSVREGTKLLSYNPSTKQLAPSTVTSAFALYANNTYTFNHVLKVDSAEVMYVNGTWMNASNVRLGDTLYSPLNNSYIKVTNITIRHHGGLVYDFIASPINNFIGNGYLIDKVTTSGGAGCSISSFDTVELANDTVVGIGSLSIGDVIEGYDNSTGKVVPTTVVGVEGYNVHQEYIINSNLTIDGNEVLMVNGRMQTASNITVGDKLFDPYTHAQVNVSTLDLVSGNFTVYDVNTAPTDNYVANGYLVT